MAETRRVETKISFNGKNVDGILTPYLESISYTDVAKDSSDTLDINLQNINMKWLNEWYPSKGDRIIGKIIFKSWNAPGEDFTLSCGTFILDDISFSGNPKAAKFASLALPANASFTCLERTKTWKKVTVKKVATEISRRYRMGLSYEAPTINISKLEQSVESDSAFMYKMCQEYNLGMKVYNNKLVIYDPGKMELKPSVVTLTPQSFIDGDWTFNDSLNGTYNGARISYRQGDNSTKTSSIYVGSVKESSEKARTLRISEVANSKADAKYKAIAQINKSNEEATMLSGTVWPDPRLVAGACVTVTGFGVPNGKYFLEKVTTEITDSGTSQRVEMHKVVPRIRRT